MIFNIEIPNKNKLLIVGTGCSLDFFDLSKINRETTAIITINSAISIIESDYHVASDDVFIQYAKKYIENTKVIITREKNRRILDKLPAIIISDLMYREYTGSGAEAMNFAYYLNLSCFFETIEYVGLDNLGFQKDKKTAYYANKIKDIPRHHITMTKGDLNYVGWSLIDGKNSCRDRQFNTIRKLCADFNFAKRLRSFSVIDFALRKQRALDVVTPEFKWAMAGRRHKNR